MTTSQTFHASISPKILDKVTRLFNASPTDIFNELIQNARRAGATRIDVHPVDDDNGPAVVFRDDGCGVADLRTLLALGDSGWEPSTQTREDPAGMGCFSLSRRRSVIRSRPRNAAAGWSMVLTPEQFTGKAPVMAEPCDMEPGTEVVFAWDQAESARGCLAQAARYCPVPVYFEGERLEQQDFLEGAVHVETWNGVRIGVFKRAYWTGKPTINFHGLTLDTRLPDINMAMEREAWSVRLDILDCPYLKLVLPARKEVVQDAFLDTLKTATRQAIYRAIAREDSHRLSFGDWQEARRLGVELPEAVAELRPYQPGTADADQRCYQAPVPLVENAHLVTVDGEPPEQQCFWRAAQRSGLDLALFEPCPAYGGYDWYDRLPRISGLRHFVTDGGDCTEVLVAEEGGDRKRVDRIGIEATIRKPNGAKHTHRLDTDLVFAGDPWAIALCDVGIFVTKDSDLDLHVLAELLRAGYFSPSDDAGADSYETQDERFWDEALHIAMKLLLTEEEANIALLEAAVRRDLLWLIPRGSRTVITVKDREIHIEQTPA